MTSQRSCSPPSVFSSPTTTVPPAPTPQHPPIKRPFTTPIECHPALVSRASLGDTNGAVFLPSTNSQADKIVIEKGMLSTTPDRPTYPRSRSNDYSTFAHKAKRRRLHCLKDNSPAVDKLELPNLLPNRTSTYAQHSQKPTAASGLNVVGEGIAQDGLIDSHFSDARSINFGDCSGCKMTQQPVKYISATHTTDGASDAQDDFEPDRLWQPRRSTVNLGYFPRPSRPKHGKAEFEDNTSADRFLREMIDGDPELQRRADERSHSHFKNPFSDTRVLPSRIKLSALTLPADPSAPIGLVRNSCLPISSDLSQEIDAEDSSSSSSDETTLITYDAFQGHRDTLALINYQKRSAPQIPKSVFRTLLQYLSFEDYISLRLTSREWLSSLPKPNLPITFEFPSEIIQEIYQFLSPRSFDAARHTCKSWFLASLDQKFQLSISRQAGCEQAVEEDLQEYKANLDARRDSFERRCSLEHAGHRVQDCHQENVDARISVEWLCSKRLATEARISPGWHGIQMKSAISKSPQSVQPMHIVEDVDFSATMQDRSSFQASKPIVKAFNISSCAKFVILNSGLALHVYRFERKESPFTPVATLQCGRKVLQVSMDSSSDRYTVAVLLEGRIGMCWDLDMGTDANSSDIGEAMSFGMFASIHDVGDTRISAMPTRKDELNGEFHSIAAYNFDHSNTHATPDGNPSPTSHFRPEVITTLAQDRLYLSRVSDEHTPPAERLARMQSTVVYEHLGSPDDEPRSVAICPQRKCVAFGCRMGIELHWQDALTGGDLNRWFPLAAPSDHLHFLPQRPGLDSNKKLRLISSAHGPPSSPNSSRRGTVPSSWTHSVRSTLVRPELIQRRQTMTRLFFGSLPFPAATSNHFTNPISAYASHSPSEERQGVLRTVDCDHYQALPLSDGVHVLFTDPASDMLCLGSDAPLGGPTKLLRKFVLVPPKSGRTAPKPTPKLYAAGRDLRWGIRIVASYSDGSLVLFNVPVDLFNQVRYSRNRPDVWDEQSGILAQSDIMMDAVMDQQTPQNLPHPDNSTMASIYNNEEDGDYDGRSFRSIQITGVKILDIEDEALVEDLAVKTEHGGLKIWVFQTNGIARCLDIYAPHNIVIRQRRVIDNGFIEDINGDCQNSTKEGLFTENSGPRVHFGGLDGANEVLQQPSHGHDYRCDYHHPRRSATMGPLPKLLPFEELDPNDDMRDSANTSHSHPRSASVGAAAQQFCSDWPCDEDLMSCLAYKRMIYERMGSNRGSMSITSTGDIAKAQSSRNVHGDALAEKVKKGLAEKKSNNRMDSRAMEIEILTDWRKEILLDPYRVKLQN